MDWFMDKLAGVDWGTYYFFREQGKRLPEAVTDRLAPAVNALAGWQVVAAAGLALVVLLVARKQFRPALGVLFTFAAALALIWNLRIYMPRERPPDAAHVLAPWLWQNSFPSASVLLLSLVAVLWTMAAELFGASRKVQFSALGLAVFLIVLVILSQLLLKLNFLSDILAGLCAGIALALGCQALAFRTPAPPAAAEARP